MDGSTLTTTEVCQEYGISRRTLLRLCREGKIGGQRFGREKRFLRRRIESYINGDLDGAKSPRRVTRLPNVPRTIRR